MIPNLKLKTEYKKEAREQRARALYLEDRVSALDQENEQLRDENKALKQELSELKTRVKELDRELEYKHRPYLKQDIKPK